MTVSNHDLIDTFVTLDRTNVKSSRIEIREVDGYRAIVGYGWAVYAIEVPDLIDGSRFVVFGGGYATDGTNFGWAGYSGTTTGHLRQIRETLHERGWEPIFVDAQVKSRRKRGDDRHLLGEIENLPAFVREHRTEAPESDEMLYRQ